MAQALQFSSINWNTGKKTLDIGAVDYLLTGEPDGELAKHHIYEYSECHKHYHFMHYGTFTYGDQQPASSKRGFCLQSTDRLSNNESTPPESLLRLQLPGDRGGLGRQLQCWYRLPVDRRDGV